MRALECRLSLDPDADDLRPVSQLMHDLTGRRPSPATLWRWCSRGTSRAGVLPSLTVFGTRHTTREALVEWLRRGSEVAPVAAPESDARDQATDRRLRSAGLL